MIGAHHLFSKPILIVYLLALGSTTWANPQVPLAYQVIDLGYGASQSSGLATGFNDSDQISYFTSYSARVGYWWDGSTSLPLDPGAGYEAVPEGMNNDGLAVGYVSGNSLGFRPTAAIWNSGSLQVLGKFGGTGSVATAVNNDGVVTGWRETAPSGPRQLFLWSSTTGYQNLGSMPTTMAVATAINDQKQVIGHDVSLLKGWIRENGQFYPLPDLAGGNDTTPRDINESGLVVGWSYIQQFNQHAVTWTDRQVFALPEPSDAVRSEASCVNDAGVIVGSYWNGGGNGIDAVAWYGDTVVKLGDLARNADSIKFSNANAVNNLGHILATGYGNTTGYRYYILVPVPEPTALGFVTTAIGAAAGIGRRKCRQR